MATRSSYQSEIAQKREYFDRLVSGWDSQITEESLASLKTIIKEINIKPGSHVLDVGSGTGILVPFLIEAVKETGMIVEMDISEKMLVKAQSKNYKGNIYYIQADVAAMPFSDQFFDLVICHNSFPHFPNKLKAIKEMARVIKGAGKLVICHTMSWEAVNNLHRSLGGVVANDFLPDETKLCWLLSQAGLEKVKLENTSNRYLVIALQPISFRK